MRMLGSFSAAAAAALFLASAAQGDVPLRWIPTGHVVVPAKVNGQGPYDFILDTGADESAVFAWFVKQLDLPKGKAGELVGAMGSEAMVGTHLGTLEVDGHPIKDVEADTIPDRAELSTVAGVAGVDLMMGRLTVIDFGCGTAALQPLPSTPRKPLKGEQLIEAGSITGGKQLTLLVTLNGVEGIATLDTGARQTLINRRFATAAGLDPDGPSFNAGTPAKGATSVTMANREGVIGEVRFGGLQLKNVKARVLDLPAFQQIGWADRPAMNLGIDLLKDARLTIDYAARRIWLASSSCRRAS